MEPGSRVTTSLTPCTSAALISEHRVVSSSVSFLTGSTIADEGGFVRACGAAASCRGRKKTPLVKAGECIGSGGTGPEWAARLQLAMLPNTPVGSYSAWRPRPILFVPALERCSLSTQPLQLGSTQASWQTLVLAGPGSG